MSGCCERWAEPCRPCGHLEEGGLLYGSSTWSSAWISSSEAFAKDASFTKTAPRTVNARKQSYARLLLAYSCSKHVEKGLLTVLSFAYVIVVLLPVMCSLWGYGARLHRDSKHTHTDSIADINIQSGYGATSQPKVKLHIQARISRSRSCAY